jgi:Spy/CpxP family protein refolding chaperone
MFRRIAFAASLLLSSAALAQTAAPPANAPPAQAQPGPERREITPEQRNRFRADLETCRTEVKPQSLPRGERRKAMRSCMEAKNPELKTVFARGEARRAEMRQVRDQCRTELGDKARGPDRREAMKTCMVAKKPEMAKLFSCVDQAKAKNLQPGGERREFMRTCLRA